MKYKKIIENLNDWIWEVDVNGVYTFCSEGVYEFLGFHANEVIGKTPFDFMSVKEGNRVGSIFAKHVASRTNIVCLENTHLHKNGTQVVVETSAIANIDAKGNFLGYQGIDRNVTNLHEVNKHLLEQKELYELVFKNTSSSVLIIDIEVNKFIDCNAPAIEILKCDSKDEVLNLRPADLSPEFQPDGRRSDEKSDAMNAIALKNGSHIFEWKHLTKDGFEFWVEVILTPMRLQGKKVLHVVWKDIADRKALEEKIKNYTLELERRVIEEVEKNRLKDKELLLQSETAKAELQKLLSSFDKNVIFSITDLNGNIIHVSDAFCEISGYEASELIGKPHSIVRHPDMSKEVFKDLWETIKLEKKWQGEVKNRKKDGDYYWVFTNIEPEYNFAGKHIGYYAVRQDITAQKEVEELKNKLQNINLDLEQQVNDRVKELVALDQEIQDTQREVVFTMGAIGESRSKETGNHVKRVAEYSKLLALHYGLSQSEAEMLKQASPMHDIGKVAIPDAILNKPGRFDEAERRIMDTHAQIGYDMLKHSNRPLLKMAATVAYEHHEKWDGSGYPNGLKGEEINIYGRITALADVFDALGSDRVYKKGWELDRILNLFKEERAKHFDPKLIDIFFENIDKFLSIRDRYVDE